MIQLRVLTQRVRCLGFNLQYWGFGRGLREKKSFFKEKHRAFGIKVEKWSRSTFMEQEYCTDYCFRYFKKLGKNSENINGLAQVINKLQVEKKR